jgi:hypothetical protein
MLNKLSAEQERLIPKIRDIWIEKGLGGETFLDVSATKEAIAIMYEATSFPSPPSCILVLDSPLACQFGANMLLDLIENPFKRQVEREIEGQIWNQVRAQVRAQTGAQVEAQVRDQVGEQVEEQVRDQVREKVMEKVEDKLLQK